MISSDIYELTEHIHENNVEKGFVSPGPDPRDPNMLLLLVVSELTEAQGEIRSGHGTNETYYVCPNCGRVDPSKATNDGNGRVYCDFEENICKPEGFPIELADAIIRLLDMGTEYGIDLVKAINIKHSYNQTRPYKHGKQF